MTERLAEIQARRASVEDLRGVVDAMRSLAAVRAQQATGMLAGVRGYADIVAGALRRAAGLLPDGPPAWPTGTGGGHATILFAPEHGFVGALAERVLADAGAAGELWVVGSRGAAMLQEQGRPAAWTCAMATHSDGVIGTARRVADALYRRAAEAQLATVDLVYPVAHHGVTRETLLPVALPQGWQAAGGMPPLTNLPPDRLIALLVEEYVFAQLAHAAMEGYAAENAARLAVMVTARENIDDKLDELRGVERRLRQEEITLEVLELAGGSPAS
jgi:F-type H+-transporting ATPase subunit gamma